MNFKQYMRYSLKNFDFVRPIYFIHGETPIHLSTHPHIPHLSQLVFLYPKI